MTMIVSGSTGLEFPDGSDQTSAFTGNAAAITTGVLAQTNGGTGTTIGYNGFKNRIINGAMMIAQRGTTAVTTNNAFPVDRFTIGNGTDGSYSAEQNSSAPAGFVNSLKFTTTTADTSLASTQSIRIEHRIEGNNVADLGWGTANAQTVTLSFWVRSSLTGTFGGSIVNSATDRSYPFSYIISSANTFEQKTITVAGDTTGTWLTDNGIGLRVYFGLGAGADRSGTAGAWNSNFNVSATGAVSVIGTLNATWYVTGVQLEVGSTATSFDYRPYGTELALCQRYYGRFQGTGAFAGASFGTGIANNSAQAAITLQFPQTMRAAPTISVSQLAVSDATNYDANVSSISAQYSSTTNSRLLVATSATMTALRTSLLIPQSNTSGYVDFSAEL
jgi:hypothetical protein